jgi:hypothetical protein
VTCMPAPSSPYRSMDLAATRDSWSGRLLVVFQPASAPCVYWLLGGADPACFADATTGADIAAAARGLPSNHSPLYAPVPQPTLATGIAALTTAVRTWLPPIA